MRYYEFARSLKEDISKSSMSALTSILDFLQSRIDSEQTNNNISSTLLINLMQNRGFSSFNFEDLVTAYKDNSLLQQRISKPVKNGSMEILPFEPIDQEQTDSMDQLAQPDNLMNLDNMQQPDAPELPAQDFNQTGLDMESEPQEEPLSSGPSGEIESPEGTEQTVKSMAKKALKRRQ